MLLNGILSIPVSISYTETMSSGFYQYTSFIVTGSIWNTCYLEYSHTLLVSASFTGITHYLYTIGFLVYLESINSHSTIKYVPEYVLQFSSNASRFINSWLNLYVLRCLLAINTKKRRSKR